jgi:hypothetical protein
MQAIEWVQTRRRVRAMELWLAIIVIGAALLSAVALWSVMGTGGSAEIPAPRVGHSVCIAGGVRGPCS